MILFNKYGKWNIFSLFFLLVAITAYDSDEKAYAIIKFYLHISVICALIYITVADIHYCKEKKIVLDSVLIIMSLFLEFIKNGRVLENIRKRQITSYYKLRTIVPT